MRRRDVLKTLSAAALVPPQARPAAGEFAIQVVPVSRHTIRLTLGSVPDGGALVHTSWPAPIARLESASREQTIRHAGLRLRFTPGPPSFRISDARGNPILTLPLVVCAF